MQEKIIRDFQESAEVKLAFIQQGAARIEQVVRVMAEAFEKGRKLLIFGNGGSATDASHIAAEFVNRFKIERRDLPVIALACDPAVVTSIANDYSFDRLFARQIETFGQAGDIAIGIATSGNSPNVLAGLKSARELGMITIGWTGGRCGCIRLSLRHQGQSLRRDRDRLPPASEKDALSPPEDRIGLRHHGLAGGF